jgi:hypothetical protein
MNLKVDMVTAHSLLNEPTPEGITVERVGGATKAFNLDVHLNINLDVAHVITSAAVLWLLTPISTAFRRGKNVEVNGKRLPPAETMARKMITEAIESEQQEDGSRK